MAKFVEIAASPIEGEKDKVFVLALDDKGVIRSAIYNTADGTYTVTSGSWSDEDFRSPQ